MAKYDPLRIYLGKRNGDTWPMSFPEIERVINALLPNSASNPAWWDDATPSVQARAWQAAGFNADFIRDGHIRFRRRV